MFTIFFFQMIVSLIR